jgi:urease accessory protein
VQGAPLTLLAITQRAPDAAAVQGTLTLPFELRSRSRLRANLDDGREVALFLPRGDLLRSGDLLRAEDGTTIRVQAAPEHVSTARTDDPLRLARACYHLGNRHVSLQVGTGWLRYRHDHVLDDMVRALGLAVTAEQAPFEPEPGAYPGQRAHAAGDPGHGHAHSHGHDHGHSDEDDHGRAHHHDDAQNHGQDHGH